MSFPPLLKFAAPIIMVGIFSACKKTPEVSTKICDEVHAQPLTEENADQRMACFMAGKFTKFNHSY